MGYPLSIMKPGASWKISAEELSSYSKEEIIGRFLQLQEHNIQLKNIISKLQQDSNEKHVLRKKKRELDFTKWDKAHIMLRILYCGWDYNGYAVIEGTNQTIEHHLMEALLKCRLIESRETANYARCGRTDKGVSAFMQAVSITVRAGKDQDLDYCGMLNRVLPPDIRITGWCRIPEGYSARFDCIQRHYKYFFPRANLNVQAMNEAAKYLIGIHDFRNLCKMDVSHGVVNFERAISCASISEVSKSNSTERGYQMMVFDLVGKAFLWHQVRYIMAVLLMVGWGHEPPTIIKDLLDIQQNPKKPQFQMASHLGLNLFKTNFEKCSWEVKDDELKLVISHLQELWTLHKTKTTHISEMLQYLESLTSDRIMNQANALLKKDSKIHVPLFQRNTCLSLEEKIENCKKKIKLEEKEGEA